MPFLRLLILSMAFAMNTGADDRPVFRPLPDDAAKHMERQRTFVSNLVSARFGGERITGTDKDFILLQRVLDAKLLKKSQTWELQCLGVVFGDALTKRIPGLHWMQVTDSYGTDPALIYRDTTLQLNPLTMLSKRVEDDQPVDVAELVAAVEESVKKHADNVDKRIK